MSIWGSLSHRSWTSHGINDTPDPQNEGKTVEDLNAIHGKWVDWANKQSYGGTIQGSIAVPTIADNLEVVLLIDSYPDRATFGAEADAYFGTAEGQALEAEYEAVVSCSSNAVYSETESGSR